MRPITRHENPPAFPHVCIICGLGAGPSREYFVDLGFDIEANYKAVQEGAVYLCDQCIPSVVAKLLEILDDDRNRKMDNNLLAETPEYGLISELVGGSELSGVFESEPSSEVPTGTEDPGTVPGMDSSENLPDPGLGPSSEEALGVDREPDESDHSNEPATIIPPHFRFGERVS